MGLAQSNDSVVGVRFAEMVATDTEEARGDEQ
jgi:hypothetical protein